MANQNIVQGSLSAVSKQANQSLASGFLNVKAFVMVDVSASMGVKDIDATGTKSRYDAACEQLANLQKENPGEIAVGCFSQRAEFCPGGVPVFMYSMTDMVAALRLMKMADGAGIRLILISDGEPNDEESTLKEARKFSSKIDTIFVGPETDQTGRAFLKKLSQATGGINIDSKAQDLGKLSDNVTLLIGAGA
jgi:hypothetical protein